MKYKNLNNGDLFKFSGDKTIYLKVNNDSYRRKRDHDIAQNNVWFEKYIDFSIEEMTNKGIETEVEHAH